MGGTALTGVRMNPETLELAQPDRSVLQVTMNRPQRANALNSKMAEELFGVFERPSEFAPDARCLVLTGSGYSMFGQTGGNVLLAFRPKS